MAVDERTDKLIGHVQSMIDILEDLISDMEQRAKQEENKQENDAHKVAFFHSQVKRANDLIELLEEEILESLIGIRNLSGPIEYFED